MVTTMVNVSLLTQAGRSVNSLLNSLEELRRIYSPPFFEAVDKLGEARMWFSSTEMLFGESGLV